MLKYHIGCFVLGSLCVGVWVRIGWGGIRLPAEAQIVQTKNETASVVVQQYSRIILKMGILMPEKCRVSKK